MMNLLDRLEIAARDYEQAHEDGNDVAMRDMGYAHGHLFRAAVDRIRSLCIAIEYAAGDELVSGLNANTSINPEGRP